MRVSPSLEAVELTLACQEILGRFTARQLRLAFLSQLWNAKIDFSESLMAGEVKTIEATLNVSFFCRWHGGDDDPRSIGSNVKAEFLRCRQSHNKPKGVGDSCLHREARLRWSRTEAFRQVSDRAPPLAATQPPNRVPIRSRFTWMGSLEKAQADFRAALCDSFNTPVALDVLRDVVSKTNVYINSSGKALNVGVVARATKWVGDMLRMFGLGEGSQSEGEIGWGQDRPSSLDSIVVSPDEAQFKFTSLNAR